MVTPTRILFVFWMVVRSISCFGQAQIQYNGDSSTTISLDKLSPELQERIMKSISSPNTTSNNKTQIPLKEKPFPAFSFYDLDSNIYNNESLKGKVTLVCFWEIGCPPCMWEIPYLNKLKKDYANKDFALISMTPFSEKMMNAFTGKKKAWPKMDTALTGLRKALKIEPIDYPILPTCNNAWTPKYLDDNIQIKPFCDFIENNFNVSSYPMVFILDKKGIIRAIYSGFDNAGNSIGEYTQKIDELLKE